MDPGSCVKFLAPFLVHSVAFGKWLNCGILQGAEQALRSVSFLGNKGGFLEWITSSAPRRVWMWSPCLCNLHLNWIQGSEGAGILIICKAVGRECWGSVRKPAKKGCNWIKEWTGFVERKGNRTTQAYGLTLWNKLQADTSTDNLCFGAIDRNNSKPGKREPRDGGNAFSLKPIPQPLTRPPESQPGSGEGGPYDVPLFPRVWVQRLRVFWLEVRQMLPTRTE